MALRVTYSAGLLVGLLVTLGRVGSAASQGPVVGTDKLARVGTVQATTPPEPQGFMEVRGDFKLFATSPGGVAASSTESDLGETLGEDSVDPERTTYRRNFAVRSADGKVYLDPRDDHGDLGEDSAQSGPSLRQMAQEETELENVQETEQLKASTEKLTQQIKRREEEASSPATNSILKAQLQQEILQLKQQRKEAEVAQTLKMTKQHSGNQKDAKTALAQVKREGQALKEKMQAIKDNAPRHLDAESVDSPPDLERSNHLKSRYETRGHRFCKKKVLTSSVAGDNDQAAPRCKVCVDNNHFLVPDSNERASAVGICYPVSSYSRWIDVTSKAKHDDVLPMFCAKFSTEKGATFERQDGKFVKAYEFAKRNANPNAFGFICTAATRQTETATYSTWDSKDKLFRVRVISYTTARFTECHTADPESRDLTCVKKKVLGSCRYYSVGSDERLHDREWGQSFAILPVSDSFGQSAVNPFGRRETEQEWTARAVRLAEGLFNKYRGDSEVQRATRDNGKKYDSEEFDFIGGEYGLAACSRSWKERLVALL